MMEKTINVHGKPFWVGVNANDAFSNELFHEVPKLEKQK